MDPLSPLPSGLPPTEGDVSSNESDASLSEEPLALYSRPIREWDASDRPREKLEHAGPDALSDAELIALIVGSGTRTAEGSLSALQLGRALLQTYDSLFGLTRRALKEWQRVRGIGPAKAVRLAACFEIGRRVEAQRHSAERIQLTNPADVAARYGPMLRDRPREVFMVLLLNTAQVVLREVTVSEGGLASSIVEPAAVFRQAILDHAAGIICLHNHPSGNPEPSREDIRITRRLAQAGKLMGIPVHDHIVIAGTNFTSLAERGVLSGI